VTDLVTRGRAKGAHVIVIGMPIMRSASFSKRMERVNRVTRAATEAAGGIYIDQWDLAATDDGRYREQVEIDGKRRLMRHTDGIHYSRWGAIHVARGLVPRLESHLRFAAP
jgi:hypothetical protein